MALYGTGQLCGGCVRIWCVDSACQNALGTHTMRSFSFLQSNSLRLHSDRCASARMPACHPHPPTRLPARLPVHPPICAPPPAVNNASFMITDSCKDCQGDSLLVSKAFLLPLT